MSVLSDSTWSKTPTEGQGGAELIASPPQTSLCFCFCCVLFLPPVAGFCGQMLYLLNCSKLILKTSWSLLCIVEKHLNCIWTCVIVGLVEEALEGLMQDKERKMNTKTCRPTASSSCERWSCQCIAIPPQLNLSISCEIIITALVAPGRILLTPPWPWH